MAGIEADNTGEPRLGGMSLRRRILLIVLCLGFLPTAVILIVTATAAVQATRSYLIDDASARLQTLSQRLGDQIQGEAGYLRGMAEDEELSGYLSAVLDSEHEPPPVPQQARVGLGTRKVFVFTRAGVLGSISEYGFEPGDQPEDKGLHAAARDALGAGTAEPLFVLNRSVVPGGTPEALKLWVFARSRAESAEPWDPPWLAMPMDTRAFFADLTLVSSSHDNRVSIVSPNAPDMFEEIPDAELAELVARHRQLFRTPEGVLELPSNSDVVYPYIRNAVMMNLGRGAGADSTLVITQRVDFGAPTVALFYSVWGIALFSVLLLAIIGFFGIWLSSRLVDPITTLRDGFVRLEGGDLDFRIELETGDEMQELARSMNAMAKTLRESYRNLADKVLELDEKAQQLTITYEIARAINRSLDLETLLHDIITEIRRLVPADQLTVGLLADDEGKLQFAFTHPVNSAIFPKGSSMALGGSFVERCLESGNLGVFHTNPHGDVAEEKALAALGAVTLCIVPLRTTTGPVGALVLVDTLRSAFRRQELDILKRVSASLATAVEHSRLYERQGRFATELEAEVRERTRDLREAQEQLVRAERLAATGELASNFAHEINNPLSIIKNYLKLVHGMLLRPRLSPDDLQAAKDSVTIIGEEIDRIARIVTQLRKLESPMTPEIRPVDVNQEINQLVELFRQTFREKDLRVETALDPALTACELCDDHLHQILINLLKNAYDATDTGGKITIESRGDAPDAGFLSVIVRDTGIGIPPENLNRIFTPFFTTKKEKGSGLGLSVSYGLARNMGGRIEAQSSGQGGAVLRVILPMRRPRESSEGKTPIRGQGERIIIG